MAILGVLLGITMTVLGGCIYWGHKKNLYIKDVNHALTLVHHRVEVLEKRKAVLAEAVTSQPKPAGVGAVHSRVRTWNEDAPYIDKANN